jgi:uncharacterized membrane protein
MVDSIPWDPCHATKSSLVRRQNEEGRRSLQERVAGALTLFTGSMLFVYIHLVIFGLWVVINVGWISALPKFDPSFVILAMVASVEAKLQLQINLLAEHEITRIISVVTEISKRMGIEPVKEPELRDLAQDIHPEEVLDKIEQYENKFVHQTMES